MVGTKAGGQKAAATNLKKYGPDFYRNIGSMGGRNGNTGGFAANPELAKIVGAKGGRISRRSKAPRKVRGYVYHGDGKFKMEVHREIEDRK